MSKRLFVGGLPYDMTEEKLQEIFTACGRVEKIKIMFDRATGRSKGFGFIEMATEIEGQAAILKFDGTELGTRRISVKEAKPAENRRRPGGGNGGRPHGDNRPREKRSGPGNNQGNGGGFGEQRSPRSNNGGYGEQRPPRNNGGGYGEQRPPRNNGYGAPAGGGGYGRPGGSGNTGGFGGVQGKKPYSKPGGGQGGRDRGNSDWRSELGIGTNQRKDFRRTNRDHNNRDRGHGPMGDNFGNR